MTPAQHDLAAPTAAEALPAAPARAVRPRGPRRVPRSLQVWTGRLLLLLVCLGGWDLAGSTGWVDRSLISSPGHVWDSLIDLYEGGTLVTQTLATMQAVGISLLIGVPAGVAAGLVLGSSRMLDAVVDFYLVPLNSLPRIALAPLFIVWFGLTTSAKVAVAISLVFFIMLFNTRAGVLDTDRDLVLLSRSLGMSRSARFRKIVLPGSVPVIAAGARLSVTYALLGVIASEMVGSVDGLGQFIVLSSNTLDVAGVFAVLVVLAVIGFAADRAFGLVERHLLRWQ